MNAKRFQDGGPSGKSAIRVNQVRTAEDLAAFLAALSSDAASNAGRWENGDLQEYLKAISRYLEDQGDFRRPGLFGGNLWRDLAGLFAAGKSYE